LSDLPRPPTAAAAAVAAGFDLVAELRSTLDRAGELARIAELNLRELAERGAAAGGEADLADSADPSRVTELERRLATAE
jgi:hypothetical protein